MCTAGQKQGKSRAKAGPQQGKSRGRRAHRRRHNPRGLGRGREVRPRPVPVLHAEAVVPNYGRAVRVVQRAQHIGHRVSGAAAAAAAAAGCPELESQRTPAALLAREVEVVSADGGAGLRVVCGTATSRSSKERQ